jgi:hypothetical protein
MLCSIQYFFELSALYNIFPIKQKWLRRNVLHYARPSLVTRRAMLNNIVACLCRSALSDVRVFLQNGT